MKKIVFILIAVLSFGLSISKVQAQNIDYDAVRTSTYKYLKKNPAVAYQEPLHDLVAESLKVFNQKYKYGHRIDQHDIDMLYGEEGQTGIIDYIYSVNGIKNRASLSIFEVAALRLINVDFFNIHSIPNKETLIDLCFEVLEQDTVVLPIDVPFFIYDGFFREIINLIEETPDNDKKTRLLLKLQDLIEEAQKFKEIASVDKAKLNTFEAEYNSLSTKHMFEISEANIKPNDIRTYLLNNYLDKDYIASEQIMTKSTDEIIESVILKLIQKGKYLEGKDVDLLIGDGRLYYYLVQRADNTPETDNNKRERMAQIIFLDEYIRISKFSYGKEHIYSHRFEYFNTYHALKTTDDWTELRALPERYSRELKATRIK
ncbi:MAG: hypothetical protein WCQ47_03440 [bacterium]